MDIAKDTLKTGAYDEKTLVNIVCSKGTIKRYMKDDRFATHWDREKFHHDLGRLCVYKAGTKKRPYIIEQLIDVPHTKAEDKLKKEIYKHLATDILEFAIDNVGSAAPVPLWELIQKTGLANSNYIFLRSHTADMAELMSCTPADIEVFYMRVTDPLKRYLRRTLELLRETGAIEVKKVQVVTTIEERHIEREDGSITLQRVHDRHEATKAELSLIEAISVELEALCGITSSNEKGFGYKAYRYGLLYRRRLAEHNIMSCQEGFLIRCKNSDTAKTILERLDPLPGNIRHSALHEEMKEHLVKHAEERDERSDGVEPIELFLDLVNLVLSPNVGSLEFENRSKHGRPKGRRNAVVQYEDVYRGYYRKELA